MNISIWMWKSNIKGLVARRGAACYNRPASSRSGGSLEEADQ
jgi:hypothetical protein